ncbi:MAG: hypothetical protein NTX24_00685 [Candidatus Pacearchaeota archaeon]|nr:hypothetical protein [Candidatus Pacearchaeota archaeon]
MTDINNQYAEAEAIARKLEPFSCGAFIVGGVAYDPGAFQRRTELEVIVVVPNFRNTNFVAIENALGRKLNQHAIEHASRGRMGVFDTHYNAEGGFATGVYLRSDEAHESVCNLGSYERFTDRAGVPRSCRLWGMNGRETVSAEAESVEGGTIFRHYSVLDKNGELWLGFPALNILMTPTILTGEDFLQSSFDTFNANLRTKIRERYGEDNSAASLVNCIPPRLADSVPDTLKDELRGFLD